jgi:hypothetical protein
LVSLIDAASSRELETVESPENEEPCWLGGSAGFSKVDDLDEIVNYLPASLLRYSLSVWGRI